VNLNATPPPAVPPGDEAKGKEPDAKEAQEYGMIGLLSSGAGGDPNAPTTPWGKDDSVDNEPLSAKGNMGGTQRPPTIRMGATSVSGRLPPEVIQKIVRSNFGRLRLCYEDGLRNNPRLKGRVSVRFVIGRDGSVSAAASSGSDMADTRMVSCVVRVFSGLAFPPPEGGLVTVVYPINFEPGDAAAAVKAPPPPPPAKKP